MKDKLIDRINNKEIDIPNSLGYRLLTRLITIWINRRNRPEFHYHFDKAEMKGKQVIIIADHAAWDSFFYVMIGYPFVKLNTVVGYHHIFKKYLYTVVMKIFRTIPKKNFQNDLGSVKQMLKLVKKGGSILLFPEGTQSKSGSTVPITPSTSGFLKKMGVTVVLCKSYGSFLARPIWSDETNKGHQEFHYQVLFTPEELQKLSKEEIDERMLEGIRYNDFQWNKEKGYTYKCKDGNAKGMERVAFLCPKCGKEFTLRTTASQIICDDCGNSIDVNEKFELSPAADKDLCPYENIDQWYKAQRNGTRRAVTKENFKMEYDCQLCKLETDKTRKEPFIMKGRGHITIRKEGIQFRGIKQDKGPEGKEKLKLDFDIKNIPSMLATPGKFNILYYGKDVFKIIPVDNKNIPIKSMIAVEELHNMTDPIWDKAMCDVYCDGMEKNCD